ncbi:hypothetical protein CK203_044911 [Vitis vinifera]|uniref:Uncharacterized protein n=1 Tax=Vitis vinifera TaxID=29760 RepID=A0A438HFG6_VITVI|nr:hypothetical protein CK203_044911 [Vitis vinifera]
MQRVAYRRRDQIFVHSLDTPSWVRVEGRLVWYSERSSMDQQVVIVDQFTATVASIQEALASLSVSGLTLCIAWHSEVAPPTVVPITITDDTHARMDCLEQCMRQMRVSDGSVVWDDFESMPVASFSTKFKMPDIERYTGIGCPHVSRRELEALRQRTDEFVSSFISYWHGRLPRSLTGLQRGIRYRCDVKGKKPFGGQRSRDVSAISSSSQRPLRRHQAGIERPPVSYTATRQPCYAAQFTARPTTPYPRPRAQQSSAPFALRTQRQFSQLGMPLSQALWKLTEAGLLTALTPRSPPQPIPPQFRMDLHCAYHQGPGHETDHSDDIHFLDFDEIDDHIHMLSGDDSDPEPIMPDVIYEMSERPFILIPDVEEVQGPPVDDSQTLDVQYIL